MTLALTRFETVSVKVSYSDLGLAGRSEAFRRFVRL